MKKILFALFMPVLASAAPLRDADLFNVYSIGNIQARQADFEGITGAGGDVLLSSFSVAEKIENLELGGLYVGNNLRAYDGSSSGGLYVGGSRTLVNFDFCCFYRRAALGFDPAAIAQYLYNVSDSYAAMKPTGRPRVLGNVIEIVTQKDVPNVFELNAQQLSHAGVVRIMGFAGTPVVINVIGNGAASLVAMDLELAGGLNANDVVYNFPHITQLHIERAGHSSFSARPGLQGTFLAPRAATTFYSALIVGRLFVGDLDDVHGQVNVIPSQAWSPPSMPDPVQQEPVTPTPVKGKPDSHDSRQEMSKGSTAPAPTPVLTPAPVPSPIKAPKQQQR